MWRARRSATRRRLLIAASVAAVAAVAGLAALVAVQGFVLGEPLRTGSAAVAAGAGPPALRGPDAPNFLLVSIDTLRADHLGCYGYDRPTSPHIDRFAADAALFETAVAHAPSTLPSHASIFTSLIPAHHGAYKTDWQPLAPELTTIAEVLAEAGYRTAGFHSGGQMAAEFGVAQGFEVYRELHHKLAPSLDVALAWLDARPEPFFLFLHTYEVHLPYEPEPERLALFERGYDGPLPDEIGEDLARRFNAMKEPHLEIDADDVAHVVAAYDAEIHSMDAAFGALLDGLRERGLYERTVVIVTADHGEEFGEHGVVAHHAHTLYDELLLVPLVIRVPGSRARGVRVASQVRGIDIAPTILELAGLPAHPQFEGESLLALFGAGGDDRPAVSQRDTRLFPRETVLRTREWKLFERRSRIWKGDGWQLYRWKLYDLANDPGERHDVLVRRLPAARAMGRALVEQTGRWMAGRGEKVEVSEETQRQLKELGYVE